MAGWIDILSKPDHLGYVSWLLYIHDGWRFRKLLDSNCLARVRPSWKGLHASVRAARMSKRTVDELLSFIDRAAPSSTIDENERTAMYQVWTLLIDGGLERGESLVAGLERTRLVPGVFSPDLVYHASILLASTSLPVMCIYVYLSGKLAA